MLRLETAYHTKMPSWGTQSKYGDYEIVGYREGKPRMLGEGSFGKTFEGMHVDNVAGEEIRESVAIKVLNPELLVGEASRFQFIQEVKALAKFRHPNLIQYIRCSEQNGEIFYAMDLLRGGDLSKLVRRFGPLPERVAALIGVQVAAGLREVHQKHRLVHRDLKPSNIMLADEIDSDLTLQTLGFRFEQDESLCRIVDFGLVDFTMNAQDSKQKFVGSPMYASPEQICEQPVDARSDIYSLGMTLWYLVQGKGPLLDSAGKDLRSMRDAMIRHTMPEEHEPDLPRHLSPEFRALLGKMVAKSPQNRFVNASELQNSIRDYLRNPVTAPSEQQVAQVALTRIDEPLDSAFVVEYTLPSRSPTKSYLAVERTTGFRVKLNAVADLQHNDPANVDALARYLCDLAGLSQQPSLPPALLPVREVIMASDTLACTEEMVPHVALADVLRARANAKRSMSFSEAVTFLRPIAEGLDYMINNGKETVFLPCEEVMLTGKALVERPEDPQVLIQPLTDWEEMQVHFSMMCLPSGPPDQGGYGVESGETVSGSLHMSDADLHPVPAFVRLVYRTLNGSEVPAAAGFTPNAYVPAVTLVHSSNVLLRDLLCRQKPWNGVTSILRELCANEGVPWRANPAATGSTVSRSNWGSRGIAPSTRMSTGGAGVSHPATSRGAQGTGGYGSSGYGSSGHGSQGTGSHGSGVGSHGTGSQGAQGSGTGSYGSGGYGAAARGTESFGAGRPTGSSMGGSAGADASNRAAGSSNRPPASSSYPPPSTGSYLPPDDGPSAVDSLAQTVGPIKGNVSWPSGGAPSSTFGSSTASTPAEASVAPGGEQLCEFVSPGVVRSPYATEQTQVVAPKEWVPGGRVRCQVTRRFFKLPRQLDNLLAKVESPGLIQSPYAPEGSPQRVPWEQWIPGGKIVCQFSAKPLALPMDLPLPDGIPSPEGAGLIISPYDRRTVVQVPATLWRPGGEVFCPATQMSFLLPANLLPLKALASLDQPGLLGTPYGDSTWYSGPEEWIAGRVVTCPISQQPLALPPEVEQWPAEASLVDPVRRLVSNPFKPGSNITVPASAWVSQGRISCPQTGRPVILPADLPPLTGEPIPNRPGFVQSPYTGEPVSIPLRDWLPGAEATCPKTGARFVLPANLPEWIPVGSVNGLPPGTVRSPYGSSSELAVPPDQWTPNRVLECPETGRRFSLPSDLPLLEGGAQIGSPGKIASPFTGKVQDVPLDDWVAGGQVVCSETRRTFALPRNLEEWLPEGAWIPGFPGRVRSPYRTNPEVTVAPVDWASGGLVTCTASKRRFRLPAESQLPSLDLEQGAVAYALEEPEADEQAAAQALTAKHSDATASLVQSIWARHGLDTLEKRRRSVQTGEALPEAPGFVRSPYKSRVRVTVPPAQWEPRAPMRCPETGQRFILPDTLPPLVAQALADQPGMVASPFAPDQPFMVNPADWKGGTRLNCPHTGRPIVLPSRLPAWNPVGKVDENRLGTIYSPFGNHPAVHVEGQNWAPGTAIICPQTGYTFALPQDLPPLVGALASTPGFVLSPYAPDENVRITPDRWYGGAPATCSRTRRPFVLPPNVPPLVAQLFEGRSGVVRSPYTGETVQVAPQDWSAGHEIACAPPHGRFVLPTPLPEWVVDGSTEGLPPGSVRSPYNASSVIDVPPANWTPNEKLVCPATGRPFKLPARLDPLEGRVREGIPGRVISPYSGEAQDVSVEEWKPGRKIKCLKTEREFVLPQKLEEWIVDGIWIPGAPGRIRSPYRPCPEMDISQDDWKAGGVLTCTSTRRRFRIPAEDNFPTLQLEKDAVQYAMAEPDSNEDAATLALERRHRGASTEQIHAIWKRHELDTVAKRRGKVQTAEIIPDAPGAVRSPYGARKRVDIPPARWIEPHATVRCPETGLLFALPDNLPPLRAVADAHDPGMVSSPFAPDQPFQMPPNAWKPGQMVECPHTGHMLQLPPNLPDWDPTGVVKEGEPGMVVSPFVPRRAMKVDGAQWVAGGTVICAATQQNFRLPAKLPPLTGTLIPGAPGQVLSPYAPGAKVQLIHKQWVPGGQAVCSQTGRIFTLPQTLPPWEKKGFPMALAAIPVGVAVLAGALFLTPLKTVVFGGKPTPVPKIVNDPGTPKPIDGGKTPVAGQSQWPDGISLLEGVDPRDAAIYLATGPDNRVRVYPEETSGRRRTLRLSSPKNQAAQSWVHQNGKAKDWRLEFEAPKFEKVGYVTSPVVINPGGGGDFERPTVVKMPREVASVKWDVQPFLAAAYDGIRFKQKEPLETDDDLDPQPIKSGTFNVPTGEYTVSLVGKKGFSVDRVVDTKLSVQKGGENRVNMPPAIPRALAGIGSYTGMKVSCVAYGDRVAKELSVPQPEFINYWTPCLVIFDADFKHGKIIDENSLLGASGFSTLDTMVVALAKFDQKKKPGKGPRDYDGYKENKETLKQAFETWNRPAAVDVKSLIAQREQMFTLAGKIGESAQKRGNPEELVEVGSGANLRNDMRLNLKYFSQFKAVLENGAWERLATAALATSPTSFDAKDLATLTAPVGFDNTRDLPGMFVEQSFSVTSIDREGTPQISASVGFYNVYSPAKPDLLELSMVLDRAKSGFVLSGSFDRDTKRVIPLTPVDLK